MNKIIIYLLLFSQLFFFIGSYSINLIDSYNFGSGIYYFNFDNSKYDYYVFGNYLTNNNIIHFNFCYELSSLYIYYYTSYTQMSKSAISNYIDSFYVVAMESKYYPQDNKYCYTFDYKKTGSNLYYYIAIHLPDGATYTTYPMEINSYTPQGLAFLDNTYIFDSGKDSFYFERSKYEYYVLGGSLNSNDRIYFKFYCTSSDLKAYTYASENSIVRDDIQSYISYFKYQQMDVYYDYNEDGNRFSFDYKKTGRYDYYYIALHLPDSASSRRYFIIVDSYTISTTQVLLIIFIIIGVLIGLALLSMGIAKMMGRSPLDGLLCFFILCAICCCRKR